jgi:hypothetical protein
MLDLGIQGENCNLGGFGDRGGFNGISEYENTASTGVGSSFCVVNQERMRNIRSRIYSFFRE